MPDNITLALAWTIAEALLPENWELGLSTGGHGRRDLYTATATYCYSLRHYRANVGKARFTPFEMAHAEDPTEALIALADQLRER